MVNNRLYLATAIVVSSIILGLFFYNSRQQKNTVKVVGYAVTAFESDLVQWNFNISETSSFADMKNGYKRLNKKIKKLKIIIKNENIDKVELSFKPVRINDVYDRNGNIISKKLSQEVVLASEDIDQIEKLSTDPIVFIENNILFEYSHLNYYYTKLDLIKKELLGKAIINAKERATEILTAVENNVGDLEYARSGVFQITEPLSTEVSGYGMHSTSTRKKNIKVTVSAEFKIE